MPAATRASCNQVQLSLLLAALEACSFMLSICNGYLFAVLAAACAPLSGRTLQQAAFGPRLLQIQYTLMQSSHWTDAILLEISRVKLQRRWISRGLRLSLWPFSFDSEGVRIPAATTDPGTPHEGRQLPRRTQVHPPLNLQIRFHALSLAVFVG